MEQKGIRVKYIYQQNKGVGAAVNAGLKVFEGEYLCRIDADDYLEPQSVELRVKCFMENSSISIVTSDAYYRDSDSLSIVKSYALKQEADVNGKELFERLIQGDSVFCSGCHMIKTRDFLKINPNREIYPCPRGQN